MADYDAGRAFLQIVPSFRGVAEQVRGQAKEWADQIERAVAKALPAGFTEGAQATEAIARDKGGKGGEAYGGAFARTVKTRVEAALKALPDVKITPDSTEFDLRIAAIRAELKTLSGQQIGVDLDAGVALAQLERLRTELRQIGSESPSLNVRADTATASAALDKLSAEIHKVADESPTVKVDADTAAADAKLAETKAESDRLGRESPTIRPNVDSGSANAGIAGIRASLLALATPVVIPVAVAAASLAGPLAAAGAGTLGFAAAAAPVVSRIQAVIHAQDTQVPRSAGAVGNTANAAAAAQLGLLAAQRGIVTAARENAAAQAQAAAQVRSAEESLAQAQRASLQAQQALSQARAAAVRTLQDMANSLADAQLAERQGTLALSDATANLAAVNANPASTARQRIDAQLTFDQAKQALSEQQLQVRRLAADKAAADKAGVAGSQQVRQAEQAVADARRTTADRQRALTAAQANAANVALANTNRTIGAQDALVRAQLAVSSAQNSAIASTGALGVAMGKLNPAETAAMASFRAFGAAYRAWQNALEPAVLPVITGGLSLLQSLFVPLEPIVRAAAGAFRTLENDAKKALASPFWQQAAGTFAKLTGPSIVSFGHILGNILTGLVGLALALSPTGTGVLGGLERMSAKFADFGKNASKPGSFQDFLAWVRSNLPKVAGIIKSLAESIAHVVVALAPIGGLYLGGLSLLADFVAKLPPSVLQPVVVGLIAVAGAMKLIAIASALADMNPWVLLATVLLALGVAFAYAWTHFAGFRDFMKTVAPLIINAVAPVLNIPLLIIRHWSTIKGFLVRIWNDVWGFLRTWGPLALAVLLPFLGIPLLIWQHFSTIKTYLQRAWAVAWGFLTGAWAGTAAYAGGIFRGVVGAITGAFSGLTNFFKSLWSGIGNVFTSGINRIIDFVNTLIGGIDWVLRHLHLPEIPKIGLIGAGGGGGGGGSSGPSSRGGGTQRRAFSAGGVIPGYAPGVDSVPARLSPGEAVLVPEAVRAIGPGVILGWNAHFSGGRTAGPSGSGGYAGGGLVGAVEASLGAIGDMATAVVTKGARWVLEHIIPTIADAAGHLPAPAGQLGAGAIRYLGDQLIRWLDGQSGTIAAAAAAAGAAASAANAGTGGGGGGAGGAAQWAGVVGQALKLLGQPGSLVNAVLSLIKFESGGDPGAINKTDINWQHGTPSVGLAQVIGPTFRGNAGPYLATGPFAYGVSMNPLANVYAGLHYGIARYGSISNIPGIQSVQHGGPYLPYDVGGYLPPGVSTIVNNTGRPEPVLTGAQWDLLAASVKGGNGPTVITGTLDLGDGLTGIVHGILEQDTGRQAQQIRYGRRVVI